MTRHDIVHFAMRFNGVKRGSTEHKAIIDGYNNINPLPRGYVVKYTDAWCATFASYVFSNFTADFPFECSCGKMIEKSQKMGIWEENDAYTPKIGDVILYDWSDSGIGDNAGTPDHVGIVVTIDGAKMQVIEGNKNDAVGIRNMSVNGRFIRGYILPHFTEVKQESDEPAAYAASAWVKCKSKGVLDGTRPHDPLTREQLACVLERLGLV